MLMYTMIFENHQIELSTTVLVRDLHRNNFFNEIFESSLGSSSSEPLCEEFAEFRRCLLKFISRKRNHRTGRNINSINRSPYVEENGRLVRDTLEYDKAIGGTISLRIANVASKLCFALFFK